MAEAFQIAITLLIGLNAELITIISLTLKVTIIAVIYGSIIGIPIAAGLALFRFWGRNVIIALITALMGFPPVVVGLLVYILLSRAGPLGDLGILFTPDAMIIAQAILITPIIAGLSIKTFQRVHRSHGHFLKSLGLTRMRMTFTYLKEEINEIMINILAGLGRGLAEVGAIIMVGGNIKGITRTITTTISLETSKGELALAIALGIVLIMMIFAINLLVVQLRSWMMKRQGGEGDDDFAY